MKNSWARLAGWIDSKGLRERALIFAALVAFLVMSINSFVLSRFVATEAKLQRQMKADRTAIETLQKEIAKLADSMPADPNTQGREHVQKLAAQLEGLDQEVGTIQKSLVNPKQILPLVDGIVRRQAGLELISITKLAPVGMTLKPEPAKAPAPSGSPVVAAAPAVPADKSAEPAPVMYRHAVEVVVRGSYGDLVNYLNALEKMPQQIFWGRAKLTTDEYPKSTLNIELFTLGLEKTWLNL